MSFNEAMKEIAHIAAELTNETMQNLETGQVQHEDDLTGVLVGMLAAGLKGIKTQGITWKTSILTHRKSGAETKYGADLLIFVKLDTPEIKYSKGVLVQAKRVGPGVNLTSTAHADLKLQCAKMLNRSAASFVFAYDANGMRCGSATKISGARDRAIYAQCNWTPYRFILELFRCPIGDPKIRSVDVRKLPVADAIRITGKGEVELDPPVKQVS